MPRQSDSFVGIHAQFPEHRDLLARLSRESEDFRALCEDYELARTTLESLETWQPIPAARAAEYRSLVEELRQAIAEAIARSGADRHEGS